MRIAVERGPDRVRTRLEGGALSPRLLRSDASGAAVAVVATGALLLGGDHVAVEVEVGDGASLEIVETAGTVAYDAGGEPSSWSVRVRLGAGARLTWEGLPFVVADGADVLRTTDVELGDGARALLREVLVLGRTGETGGALRARTSVRQAGAELLVEDLDLGPTARTAPGVLGRARVVDTVLALGWRPPAGDPSARGTRFDLDGAGALARLLGTAAHSASLSPWWSSWGAGTAAPPAASPAAPDEVALLPCTGVAAV
ncbi:urease accessory protein UreD [Georgenia muralis]|uniref:Urease accessory protein UreD n=1 Tax=Georgenia muralis TaxID=154117 RepID=A0A3N4ZL03_9MICO|nr:urease accessory protein UreD [Georgenia muralis]RPF26448.1 urease accessory protein [Georgenia muralis]